MRSLGKISLELSKRPKVAAVRSRKLRPGPKGDLCSSVTRTKIPVPISFEAQDFLRRSLHPQHPLRRSLQALFEDVREDVREDVIAVRDQNSAKGER